MSSPEPHVGPGGDGGDDDPALTGEGEPPQRRLAEFLRQAVRAISEMVEGLPAAGVTDRVSEQVLLAWAEHRERVVGYIDLFETEAGPWQETPLFDHGLTGASLRAKLSAFVRARNRWDAFKGAVSARAKRIYGRALRNTIGPVVDSLKSAIIQELPGLATALEVIKETVDLLNVVVDEVEVA